MKKTLNGEWKEWEVSVKIPSKLTKKERQVLDWLDEIIVERKQKQKRDLGKLIWKKGDVMGDQRGFQEFMATEHLCKRCRFQILTCEAKEGDIHYGLQDNYINDNIIDCKYYKTREGNKNDK